MSKNKLTTTIHAVNGGSDTLILVGKSDLFGFSDGKKSENRMGTKLDCVAPGNRLVSLTVKIEGPDPFPHFSDSDIGSMVASMAFPLVKLTNAVVSLYTMNGNLGMTVTADGAILVEPKK
ncbi:hypothetical protein FRZ06_13190 [Anoxybacterium hadale]|uniref:Uncharacterized protein n=1 Tax=Anoxybacterium hadale TaxID=3408580 RepID=A0ACD1ACM5_9FIRM|nr:hypothetical protein FRZ06_13190 [Clostridiales bacterium]